MVLLHLEPPRVRSICHGSDKCIVGIDTKGHITSYELFRGELYAACPTRRLHDFCRRELKGLLESSY